MPFCHKLKFFCVPAFFLLVVSGCDQIEKPPIRLGFVGGLTGRTANLGISGRDGTVLAVEEINRRGGIDGRRIELIVRDDKQDKVAGLKAINELISEKVPAIIGPMTSSMGVIMAPVINDSESLMVSPTVSTMMLGRMDDNFLRIYPQCMIIAKSLANYVHEQKSLRRFVIISDDGNRAFTESWEGCFSEQFLSLGGSIVGKVKFTSGGSHRFTDLAAETLRGRPDGILILANSLDTAMLAQQFMKAGKRIPIFTSEWSMTRDLLNSGGRSVEGVTLFHTFNEASEKQEYLDFKKRYRDRFNQDPSFPAIHAYDATQLVLTGLKLGARTGPELKKTLLQQKSFEGLQANVKFDSYGDVKRDLFLTVVHDGAFVVVRQFLLDDAKVAR